MESSSVQKMNTEMDTWTHVASNLLFPESTLRFRD